MQRKLFRIEQMMAPRPVPAAHRSNGEAAPAFGLSSIHDIIGRQRRELAALIGDRHERRLARARDELGAAVASTDKAAQSVLGFAEHIDESARSLVATLKGEYERGLAHDIQDNVVRIYEACNFQDLAGQRIGKVMAMLETIERQIAGMLAQCDRASPLPAGAAKFDGGLINGPKLDGDKGHADQREIDAIFSSKPISAEVTR